MTPFLTLSISLINFWKPDCFSWNRNKKAKPITKLVPTLCDCFSSSTFPDDSGNLQSRTKVLGHFCRKFLDVFQYQPPPPPPLFTSQKMLHAYIQKFSPSFSFVEGGGRENCKKISKRKHCLMREPRNYRKFWILHYCPKDFLSMIVVFIRIISSRVESECCFY